MPSILVTRKLPASVLSRLEAVGQVDVHAGDAPMQPDELRARVAGKDALVCMITEQIDRRVIEAGTALRVVANVAVGYNNVDVAYARSRGVIVTNTPDVLTRTVADFTWALILAITRRLSEGERLVRRGEWKGWAFDFMLGSDLTGKQLGLVGLGRIGRAVAERASAFGMRVAFSSRRDATPQGAGAAPGDAASPAPPGAAERSPGERGSDGLERMPLDRLLNTSDVLSLHVPLTAETRHLIDRRALARMKRSAYLVNTARGPVVDEAALAWALRERLIAGAALDVYENEPAIHPDLLQLENVLLAPHLGSGTTETRTAMANLAVDNVAAVLSGRPPVTAVRA
jgi:glyoxylate reductase